MPRHEGLVEPAPRVVPPREVGPGTQADTIAQRVLVLSARPHTETPIPDVVMPSASRRNGRPPMWMILSSEVPPMLVSGARAKPA